MQDKCFLESEEISLPQKRGRGSVELIGRQKVWRMDNGQEIWMVAARNARVSSFCESADFARLRETLATFCLMSGRRQRSYQYFKQAIDLYKDQIDQEQLGYLFMKLGTACSPTWDTNSQVTPLYEAGKLFKTLRNCTEFGRVCELLSSTYSLTKCPETAQSLLAQASWTARQTGSQFELASVLETSAASAFTQRKAVGALKESAEIWEALCLRENQVRCLLKLAQVYLVWKKPELAMPVCNRAAELIRIFNLKNLLVKAENYPDSFFFAKQSGPGILLSLEINRTPQRLENCIIRLLKALRLSGHCQEALEFWNSQTSENYQSLPCLFEKGKLLYALGDYQGAMKTLFSRKTYQYRKNYTNKMLYLCAQACLSDGQYTQAKKYFGRWAYISTQTWSLASKKRTARGLLELAMTNDLLGNYKRAQEILKLRKQLTGSHSKKFTRQMRHYRLRQQYSILFS